MKRVAAIVIVAALVGGLGGAGLALALGSSKTTTREESVAAPRSRAPVAVTGALTAEQIYRRAAPGVVVITATQTQSVPPTFFTPPSQQRVQVLGSGFVLDAKGDVVTNEHVVANGSDVLVGFSGGATYPAKVLGTDPSTDLAVLRVKAPAKALHPLVLDRSNVVEVGDSVYAIGNPFGLDRTMTAGIISATGRDIQAPNGLGIANSIQTDAPINHGNSGGPLLDSRGRVIGINDQIESGGAVDANVGVGFAVASDTARTVIPQLIARGRVEHAWLGVAVAPVDPTLAQVVKGLPAHGVLVLEVVKGGPAAKAGIRAGKRQITVNGESALVGGDAIVSIDGKPIRTVEQLADAVRARHPGDTIRIGLVGPAGRRTVAVTLGNAPGAQS